MAEQQQMTLPPGWVRLSLPRPEPITDPETLRLMTGWKLSDEAREDIRKIEEAVIRG